MTILENNGLLNQLFQKIGLIALYNQLTGSNLEYFSMINTQGAVVLGMVYNYLPFMILPIYSVIVKLDNGKAYDIPMNREANMNEALNYIASNMPYLFIGYDKDFEKLYNKNRMDMRQIVRSRKQEYEVNMTGTAGDMASAPDAEMQKF